jgi:hypothetical protein
MAEAAHGGARRLTTSRSDGLDERGLHGPNLGTEAMTQRAQLGRGQPQRLRGDLDRLHIAHGPSYAAVPPLGSSISCATRLSTTGSWPVLSFLRSA